MDPDRGSRFQRFGAVRAANWVIISGLVMVVAAIVSGLLNAFRSSLYFGFGGGGGQPEPGFLDRVQMFLGQALNNIIFALLVVAAGVAAHVLATRSLASAAASPALLPEPEMPESPVELPDRAATKVVLVEPSPDDDVWRR